MTNIIFKNDDYDYDLKVNLNSLFNEEWIKFLGISFFKDKYFTKMIFNLNETYNKKDVKIYPNKKDIFKLFKLTKPKENIVYIINCEPTYNKNNNGIAYGNKSNFFTEEYDNDLVNLFAKINNYNNVKEKSSDYSLESWVKQGVFLYNAALTGTSVSCHRARWFKFTRYLINKLSSLGQGTIFVLIGKNENHKRMVRNSLDLKSVTLIEAEQLNYKLLNQINAEIDLNYGPSYRIKW